VGRGVSIGGGVDVGRGVSVGIGGGVVAGEEQEISRRKQNTEGRTRDAMFLCIRSILTEMRLSYGKRNNLIQSSCLCRAIFCERCTPPARVVENVMM
jgi:hypothetical protein